MQLANKLFHLTPFLQEEKWPPSLFHTEFCNPVNCNLFGLIITVNSEKLCSRSIIISTNKGREKYIELSLSRPMLQTSTCALEVPWWRCFCIFPAELFFVFCFGVCMYMCMHVCVCLCGWKCVCDCAEARGNLQCCLHYLLWFVFTFFAISFLSLLLTWDWWRSLG